MTKMLKAIVALIIGGLEPAVKEYNTKNARVKTKLALLGILNIPRNVKNIPAINTTFKPLIARI